MDGGATPRHDGVGCRGDAPFITCECIRGVNPAFNPVVQAVRMDPTQIGIFDLAERRLDWVDRRQAVLAQNIANANTPQYQPHDVQPFVAALDTAAVIAPVRTQPDHLAGTVDTSSQAELVQRPAAHAPDGNAVALDEQLVKV